MTCSSWPALPQRVGVSARSLDGGLDWIGKAAAQLLVSASTQGGSQRQEFGLLVLHLVLLVCVALLADGALSPSTQGMFYHLF